jgi:hypothetical protein
MGFMEIFLHDKGMGWKQLYGTMKIGEGGCNR